MITENLSQQPLVFWFCSVILAFLVFEAVVSAGAPGQFQRSLDRDHGAWYLIEPFYAPEGFVQFSAETLENAFLQVALFLGAFRLAMPPLTRMASPPRYSVVAGPADIPAEAFLMYVVALWVVLFAFGVYGMDGDIFGRSLSYRQPGRRTNVVARSSW